jgi:hypothetical protein
MFDIFTHQEMQIKTTLRFHLTSQNGCQENKTQQMLVRMVGVGIIYTLWVGK